MDRSRSYRIRRRLNADGDELVHTVNLEPESPRSVEPLWDVPRRRRFPAAPTPPTVDDSYRERRREANRHEPEAIIFSRVTSPSDSEPHSIPVNARRPPSRRRGWGKVQCMDRIQHTYYRLLIAARLDPDGNEISTDEEEMIERARTMTRRNNPQPFFSLFRPVVRGSNDSPTTSRGEDTGAPEIQQSDRTNIAQSSDTEGALEVVRFPKIHRGTDTDTVPCQFATQGSHESESNHARAVNYINPLPMPLHEMIYSPNRTGPSIYHTKRKSSRRATQISPSAHLAGR